MLKIAKQLDTYHALRIMSPESAAARIEADTDTQDTFFDLIEWHGQDWQCRDRSTGAHAGFADARPVEDWMDEVLQCLPVAMSQDWRQRGAEIATEARGRE